ncbi:MAG TPA: hypothetical protein VFC44_13535 [Candidatus Saccharimonadales bacterium]|nr:hypothetical protein [Candidatus Saccharimonadales bacterium]
MRPKFLFLVTVATIALAGLKMRADEQNCFPEPNIETALAWWPLPRNVWTPLGWKSHLFRFQVVYNGTLLCTPAGWLPKPHVQKYQGQNFQLNFFPSLDGVLPPMPHENTKVYKMDGGIGDQHWRNDMVAPVLCTDWPMQDGLIMRSEVFTHLKGGKDVVTGTEPLYAWVRLSVAYVDPVRAPQKYCFAIQLSKDYYDVSGTLEDSVFLLADPIKAKLKEPLIWKPLTSSLAKQPGAEVEQNGKVRLRVQTGGSGALSFTETGTNSGIYNLKITLPARAGAYTDLLVPILPLPKEETDAEAALDFDGALLQSEDYWKQKPSTAAYIHTPEKYINEALSRNIQFAQIIAERNPDKGEYSFLSGSYGYDTLWSTPSSMISHMCLDLLGYHAVVARNVELYKANQGTVHPPGLSYTLHPGYFSTPKSLTAIDWLTDHGAILETLSRHALLTGDQKFIDEWLEPIIKGCDFIKDSCAATNHAGVKGVMPPAVATDSGVPSQAIWNEAWTYKGLTTSIQLLKKLKHPQAAEFGSFADDFKRKFQAAFLAQTAKQPTWVASDGKSYPILPANLIPPPEHHVYDDAFLLDTGPLCLPWSGLMDASDPLMRSFADFFRYGPNNKLRGPQTGAISRAVLRHEISSCEPCYSWNIVNSWKIGDRQTFLEGLYSLFAGAISPQTFINCEHRNAMYGNVFVAPLMTWSLRQAVIDDQLAEGELHLLRLVPQSWISAREETVFANMPTEYGPVTLRFKKSKDGRTLEVFFAGAWRDKPKKIILHMPPVVGLTKIKINGKSHPAKSEIVLKDL